MSQPDVENNSESTTSSPRSHKFPIERGASQTSHLSAKREFTPPSSVASSQEVYFEVPLGGKKRSADGQVINRGHTRNTSTASLAELSESLKTKLTYAMVKVQNGWQNHSIEEVESLASVSPRTAKVSTHGLEKLNSEFAPASEVPATSKGLAPSATIVPGSKRRLAPSTYLHVNTSQPDRPRHQQRTPSQNAAMEADAVETLLFMSASPSSSGHFPGGLSTSPRKVQFSPIYSRPVQRYENKSDFIDKVLEDLDADDHEDLNQALSIMEAHKSAKLSA